MKAQYGIRISEKGKSALVKDLPSLNLESENFTYMLVKSYTVVVTTNPHIIVHGLGYVPKVIVYEINSDHNRRLPYEDVVNRKDFSITDSVVKIRGITSGTFKVLIFAQEIL